MISPTAITIDVKQQSLQVQLKNQQQIINVIQQPTTLEVKLGYDIDYLVNQLDKTKIYVDQQLKKYILRTQLVFRD